MGIKYFELGSAILEYEYTLMEYDNIPLLFTCTSDVDRYLCLCNCINNGFRWVIAKCPLNTLRSLVEQQISIRDAFREAIGEYYQVVGKADGKISYSTATFETLSAENEFPEPGLLLDNDFVENKVRAEIIREASH